VQTPAMAAKALIQPAPAFSTGDLAKTPGDDWITNGGSLSNDRFSSLDQIDASNVSQVKGVWMTHLRKSGLAAKYSAESQPIEYKGVLYVPTGEDDVFAVTADTGEILWEHKANLDQAISTVCCGWESRGVALGQGRVYIGQLDGKLVALDQKTGQVAWQKQVVNWQDGGRLDRDPDGVRDRMRHADELEPERPELDGGALGVRLAQLRGAQQAVLVELRLDETEREARRPDLVHLDLAHQERKRADMILVRVREDDSADVLVAQVAKVRKDHVHAEVLVAREGHAGIDDDRVVAGLVDRHVLPHLAKPAERDHTQYVSHRPSSLGANEQAQPFEAAAHLGDLVVRGRYER
jgi:hypothetical protein